MAEIKLRFDITFSRRLVASASALALMLFAVPELNSESVTLSTYYPAPSGVYTQMITTGNTFLARDGGAATLVGVGITAPAAKMHIVGTSQNTLSLDSAAYPELTFRTGGTQTTAGTIRAYNAIATSAGGYFAGTAINDWIFRNEGGASIKWGRGGVADMELNNAGTLRLLGYGGGAGYSGNLDATGMIISRQGNVACDAPQQYAYSSPAGGTVNICGGRYITTISGFYTKYMAVPVDRSSLIAPPVNNSFVYICCDCPVTGCVL